MHIHATAQVTEDNLQDSVFSYHVLQVLHSKFPLNYLTGPQLSNFKYPSYTEPTNKPSIYKLSEFFIFLAFLRQGITQENSVTTSRILGL